MSIGCCGILAQQIASNFLLLNNKKKEVTQLKHEILKLTMESSHLQDKLLKLIEVNKPTITLDDHMSINNIEINTWMITEENMAKYQTIVNLSVHQYALKKLEQVGCEKLMVAIADLSKLEHQATQLDIMQRVI
jgi:hypothetical protein